MWFKSGSFAGLGTDAWLFNYAVGIGSTQFPTGTRLAAGSVQFTERDLAVVNNINASGVVTASTFSGQVNAGVGTITSDNGSSFASVLNVNDVIAYSISGINSSVYVGVTSVYATKNKIEIFKHA